MWQYNHTPESNELMHYGVKGMRWGVRKVKKLATSKTQPSSFKSRVLAGAYAATGSKRIGKALDRSNDRDADDWKLAKEIYASKSFQETVKRKKVKTIIGTTAGVAAIGVGTVAVSKILKDSTYTVNGVSVDRKEFFSAAKAAFGK